MTWDEVQQYSPPPNPAKSTDARYRKYAEEFGHESWELDALEPTVLGRLVRDEVDTILDHDRWDAAVKREQAGAARPEPDERGWYQDSCKTRLQPYDLAVTASLVCLAHRFPEGSRSAATGARRSGRPGSTSAARCSGTPSSRSPSTARRSRPRPPSRTS